MLYLPKNANLAAVSLQSTLHQHIAYREGKDCRYYLLHQVFLEEHHLDVLKLRNPQTIEMNKRLKLT